MNEYSITIDQILNGDFKVIYGPTYKIRIEDDRISFCNLFSTIDELAQDYQYSFITPPKIDLDNYQALIDAIILYLEERKHYIKAVKSGRSKIHLFLKPFIMERHYQPL